MTLIKKLLPAVFVLLLVSSAKAQINLPFEVHGNFQIDAQYYLEDSTIGAAEVPPEKILSNGFGNLTFTRGNFNAGLRYESYLNPMLGFDQRYKGSGITYRYASYTVHDLNVTLGNFYEQFGSGLIFRSYEERGLGLDNCMDGILLRYAPANGILLKGFIAQQRYYFEKAGLVRGFDSEFAINDFIKSMSETKTRFTPGFALVSKYQADENDLYKLPENVLAFAPRIRITHGNFGLYTEYAYKYNDPSANNATASNPAGIYKPGQGMYINGTYTQKGLGVSLSAKFIDNMSFRSDRDALINDLQLNYLPALTRQQTYRLATLYPYATQPNGEVGYQADIFYNFKQGSQFGGKYGTYIALNYSRATGLDTTNTNDEMGYESKFFKMSKEYDDKYFEEVNVEVQKKINKDLKLLFTYIYTLYDEGVVKGLGSSFGKITANIGIVEMQLKLSKTHSMRAELQHLFTEQDKQNWIMALVEYTISPHWFVAAFDEYNYGNDESSQRLHYPNVSMGYTKGANRITLGYGKQREGLLCVGGVCRQVPASNGFSISVTSSF